MSTSSALKKPAPQARPLISVVVAVRNEANHIEASLASILAQEVRDFDLEIIIVDGDSSDGTREIIERQIDGKTNVRILRNEKRLTPFAFNLGLHNANGDYVAILGSHSVYSKSYIAVCYEGLRRTGAVGCSGRLITRPSNETLIAKLIAWTLSHPFGTSHRSMRTHPGGFANTIPYPVFLKQALLEVGGYCTHLHRNQDNDLSQRLRARGYKLYLTSETTCEYYPSPSLISLVRYAFNNGFWNWISLRENRRSMSVRHFVPFAFVFCLVCGGACFFLSHFFSQYSRLLLRLPLALSCVAYLIASLVSAVQVGLRERSGKAIALPLVFPLLHVSYGLGTFWSLLTNTLLFPFSNPKRLDTTAAYSSRT